MPEYFVERPIRRPPTHPGELMREVLAEHVRISISEASRRMGVSRQSLHAVLKGESATTAEMALRFSRLTGGTPELYLHMQDSYDLWHARKRLHDTLKEIEPAA